MERKYPKFLKNLFHLTIDDAKIPTDNDLDSKIEDLKYFMHYVWPLFLYVVKKKTWFFFRYKWKKIIKTTALVSIFGFLLYFSWIKVAVPIIIVKEKLEEINNIHEDLNKSPIPKENLLFMETMMKLESGGDYSISKGQYWGAYQICQMGREEAGIGCMDSETFLKDKDIQNWAMNKVMIKNYQYLKPVIREYKIPKRGGVRIGNNLITQSGLLAAAHLVGASRAIEYIRSNGIDVGKDGNGVSLTKYLQMNNFDLELE